MNRARVLASASGAAAFKNGTIVVLAVLGLAGIHSTLIVGIATVAFDMAFLIQGGSMLSEYVSAERSMIAVGAQASSRRFDAYASAFGRTAPCQTSL